MGAVLVLPLAKFGKKFRDAAAISFSFLGLLMATFLIPEFFSYTYVDKPVFSIALPTGGSLSFGLLIDPLSIILVNLVAFLGFLIMVYSFKYMQNDPGLTRFWFLMSVFIGSMLLLILADNLILMFIGWKIVGFCSFGLIGYYYVDQKEHWIGGPAPSPFQKPSRCGLKALIYTTFGDTALLAAIIILYLYSGTFNLMGLYQTASTWLPKMAQTPGMLAMTSVLFLAGPLAKSAQFPFHEWLPEAMSGPTPVSALIHAATMVKAGVYLIARMLPIFFFAAWLANPTNPEALTFFFATAIIGAFTIVLAGTQALVSVELKKALAYSTMGMIGYMILALGVAGLSATSLVDGVSSAIFQLITHGIFKAALFLCAGVVIHESQSIYLPEMKLSRQKMRFTWAFMWIAALALMGVPPFSGFWSKDDILVSCWASGQYALFAVALGAVILTALYTVRFMGLIFHKSRSEDGKSTEVAGESADEEASWWMVVPYGILAVLTVAIGLAGSWVSGFLNTAFQKYFVSLNLVTSSSVTAHVDPSLSGLSLSIFVATASTLMVLIGTVIAYRFYISHQSKPESLTSNHRSLGYVYAFLKNRWYIDAFYNKVFVDGVLAIRAPLVRYIETPIDYALNVGIPTFFKGVSRRFRRIQTGILSVNMLFFMAFLAFLLLILLLLGVL